MPEVFICPHCAALYKVVRVEADPPDECDLTCPVCDGPLPASEGPFILKYFLVERPRGRNPYVAAHASLRA